MKYSDSSGCKLRTFFGAGAGTFLLLLHAVLMFVKNIFTPLYHIINVVYVLGRGLFNVVFFL